MKELERRGFGDRGVYRSLARAAGLIPFAVSVKETDLLLFAERDLTSEAREMVVGERHRLEAYLRRHPGFLHALAPLPLDPAAPAIVSLMLKAAAAAGVGPMAAVAGALAERVGEALRLLSAEVIVENGGDLYMLTARERTVAIYTGEERLGARLGLRIPPGDSPLGIGTSSGRLGHSLSLGDASAATVVASSASLADAAATALGNRLRSRGDLEEGLRFAESIAGVRGAVAVCRGGLGAWGEIELTESREGGG